MSLSVDIPCPHPRHQLPDAFFIGFNSIRKNPEAILKNPFSSRECGSMTACSLEHGMTSSMRDRSFSRRIVFFLAANSARKKLRWWVMPPSY